MAGRTNQELVFDEDPFEALDPQNTAAKSGGRVKAEASSTRRLSKHRPLTTPGDLAPTASSLTATLRTALVLARSYFADYLRNPTMAGAAIIPIAAALLFRIVTGDNSKQEFTSAWLDMFYALYAFMFAGLMVTSMHTMYDMGEEAEKGGRAVLFRTGVTPLQLALGHLLAASLLLMLLCAVSCVVLGIPLPYALPLTLIGFLCILPLPIAGCALALFARTLNDIMVTSTPLIIVGLIPFVLYLQTDTLGFLIPFVPTGAMMNFAEGLAAGNLLSSQGILCLCMTALWLVLSLGLLGFALRQVRQQHD